MTKKQRKNGKQNIATIPPGSGISANSPQISSPNGNSSRAGALNSGNIANIDNNRVLLPISPGAYATARAFGVDNIAKLIISNRTMSEIAHCLGIDPADLVAFTYNLPQEDRDIIEAAKHQSAELIIERGGNILDAPNVVNIDGKEFEYPITGPQVALRQAQHKHQLYRAGIRNANYREKAQVSQDSAQVNVPAFRFEIVIAPPSPHLARIAGAGITVNGTVDNSGDGGGIRDAINPPDDSDSAETD